MSLPSITILGAGLQGSCIALGLAQLGYRVTLLEQQSAPMLGASTHNEGKIHLGFVYALDPTGETRRRMLEGGLTFAPILEKLCGPLPWDDWKSEGFRYALMPDSVASADILEASYEQVNSLLPEVIAASPVPASYFGTLPGFVWRTSHTLRGRPCVDGHPVERCYETEEVSIDPRRLAEVLVTKLRAAPLITLRCGVRVLEAERRPAGFRLLIQIGEETSELLTPAVVNCCWVDRQRIDETVGFPDDGVLTSYRVKHQVLVRPRQWDPNLVPVTMVQGPYGDFVPFRDGLIYINWYPTCRTYFGSVPPKESADPAEAQTVARHTLAIMAELFPVLKGAELHAASPCVIIARGTTDIDNLASDLHERKVFGPQFHEGWWTVDTGKLTTAPLIAYRTTQWIHREMGGIGS